MCDREGVIVLTTVKNAIRRTRQHHAIEHATLHVLAARFPHRRMAGYSDPGGFTIFGDLPLDDRCRQWMTMRSPSPIRLR